MPWPLASSSLQLVLMMKEKRGRVGEEAAVVIRFMTSSVNYSQTLRFVLMYSPPNILQILEPIVNNLNACH